MTKDAPRAASSSSLWSGQRAMRRLRLGILFFAVSIGVPFVLLIVHVYDQLRLEAYMQVRDDADALVAAIDREMHTVLAREESRKFEEFSFLNVAGDVKANFLQLSPLSQFPVDQTMPGTIGYFQLDPDGGFSSPLLPPDATSAVGVSRFGIDATSFRQRRDAEQRVLQILQQNDIAKVTGPAATAQAEEQLALSKSGSIKGESVRGKKLSKAKKDAADGAYDDLAEYEDIGLDSKVALGSQNKTSKPSTVGYQPKTYTSRKEQIALPQTEMQGEGSAAAGGAGPTAIKTFEGDVDPFQFGLLTSGHPVLYRKVWRGGKRYIQGVLMDREAFLNATIRRLFAESPLAATAELLVRHGRTEVMKLSGEQSFSARRSLVARQRLSAPFDDVELAFGAGALTVGPSFQYVVSITLLLVTVLGAGFLAIYFAGRRQIALTQQQRDFVSAVSHELRTPLTSIRMYSEMLREGWAEDGKKRSYYDFIFSESERLSRLIANVLQLAGLSRGQPLSLKEMSASQAYASVRDVVGSQISGASFTWREVRPDGRNDPQINVDTDALMQVFVNLVDNGIKFSKKTNQSVVETGFELSPTGREVRFFVRDFGPGIARDQLKKIFTLFYRPENEMTRTTKGTGIGLALVRGLADKMGGRVDVESRPGLTEFRLVLPTRGL